MRLNNLTAAPGARKGRNRVGRGPSAGQGKTCGRGHKGQNSRSGGGVRLGFEGGQLPLQKRVPTYGFKSRKGRTVASIRLSELNKIEGSEVTLASLKKARLINGNIKRARVIATGSVDRAFEVSGIHLTKNARTAIEAAGGSLQE